MCRKPICQVRKETLQRLLVPNEIVIDELDQPAPAKSIERVDLGKHLLLGLCPWHTTVKLYDVAEFANEGTASRELHADLKIIAEVQKLKAGNGALGEIDLKFRALEYPLRGP